jgi:outer membrane protein, heavy metal efflux system
MMKHSILTVLILISISGIAQENIRLVLSSIEENNLALKARRQYSQARRIENHTGLNPYDPFAEYDHLNGTPEDAGIQKDFSLVQKFDFPTAYIQKRKLAGIQDEQVELQYQAYRKDILLEAKKTIINLIYQNKRRVEIERRMAAAQQLVSDYQKRLQKGDATILEVNKARLQLLSIQNEKSGNNSQVASLSIRLQEMNGGKAVFFTDTIYPGTPVLPDFETLDKEIEANDPVLKVYVQEEKINEKKIAVQRSLALPKPEAGYHSQSILGQSYKGFHIGSSIPLWENRNRVRLEKANLVYSQLLSAAHLVEHRNENRRLYEEYLSRKSSLEEYRELISAMNNAALLNKSLRLGQITVTEYYMELSYYYSAYDKYLQMELEYQLAIAELYKHLL